MTQQEPPRSTQRASYLAAVNEPMQKSVTSQHQQNGRRDEEESFELIDVPNHTKIDWLINGEILQQHEPDAVVSTPKGDVHGEAFVTNYRLKFIPHDNNLAKDTHEFDFPLGLINAVKKYGFANNLDPRAAPRAIRGDDSYGIKVICKDLRTLKFKHQKEKHNRRALYDSLVANAFPNTNNKPFFAELYKEPFKNEGWKLFDPVKEFKRMNVPNALWEITDLNKEYNFIDTYPKVLVFPKEALDKGEAFLNKVAKFRSSRRIPALSWYDSKTQVSILRSSQPMSGVIMLQSSDDKTYLEMIWKANPASKELKIFDARPIGNAHANRFRGGGYETWYPHCKIVFLNIHSIHAIRKSLRKFKEICYPKQKPMIGAAKKPLVGGEKSNWVSHLQTILDGTHKIVTEICEEKSSCLIHCSDGWDRTSQLTSLTMLLLDSYYRTLDGFALLIEKEWLSFGHKFAIRFGHGINNPKSEERSPIFIQWIDCVWQYISEFPTAFEFNINLLKTLLDEVYSCRFGSFLFNNEKQREEARLKETTTSIWSYVFDNREQFLNSNYYSVSAPLRTTQPLKVKIWIDYYCKHSWEALENDGSGSSSSSSSESSFQQIQPQRAAPPPPPKRQPSETTKF
jgi:myotubularin-related protein 1/2